MTSESSFNNALCFGYERLSAWSDLLDRINVFPVADADTGTNLKISLAPLRWPTDKTAVQQQHLMMSATGNSGNIASAFFSELIQVEQIEDLPRLVPMGRTKARQAVGDPLPGTMLTVFDALAQSLTNGGWKHNAPDCSAIVDHLEQVVADTCDMLPVLQQAGVIDAGALGMFIFLEAYFAFLCDPSRRMRPVTEIFPGKLVISEQWKAASSSPEYCVNTLIQSSCSQEQLRKELSGYGQSVVLTGQDDQIKLHLHTQDLDPLRRRLSSIGLVKAWSGHPMAAHATAAKIAGAVHIMTDAAGSFTLEDARQLDVTLLNSYIVVKGRAYPETTCAPEMLYSAMAGGTKVSTAQASLFERQQCYLSATRLYERVLYLCVGSVYTGNYEAAAAWRSEHSLEEHFEVLDSGAASGRLGIVALAVARYAQSMTDYPSVLAFAHAAVAHSQEFVFLDQLKYLAAGGRMSKTKGFFGDLLHFKPVISPTAQGAVKVAVVRNREEQLAFALDRLVGNLDPNSTPVILVQYSDNQPWVENTAVARIGDLFPLAEIMVRPLSLTSGAHMGPGTWGVAFLPLVPTSEGSL